jgi:hypothetical protein
MTIKIKRGQSATLPVLYDGQPGFTEDTQELFIGSPGGNVNVTNGVRFKTLEEEFNSLLSPSTLESLRNENLTLKSYNLGYVDDKLVPINKSINDHTTIINDNAHKEGIAERGAVFVETFDDLKILLEDGTYDYAPCIQQAHDTASLVSSVVVYPSAKTLQVGTPIQLKNQNGNYVFGNRCVLKRVGLLATSDSPIMYYTSLSAIGSPTKTGNYNSGVYIFNMKFMGTGFGVGYKHVIAGELYFNHCTFDNTLETGVVLSGTNGVHFYGCQIAGNKKGIFCAKVSEDSYSAGYTSEGIGWNDGIYVIGGSITCSANGYGLYYSGSTSEGVIKLIHVKLLGASGAVGVYGRSFTNLVIDGGWSEYFEIGTVIKADKDTTLAGFEPDTLAVKNFQFTNHGGTYASTSNYSIYSNAVRTVIDDCVFNNNPYQQHIYYSSGTPNTLRINLSQTPTVIDTTYGTITFASANIIDKRDLIITSGGITYYLIFNADMGANGYKYNTYTYSVPVEARPREWRYGTYNDKYLLTRITNPTLALATVYTITSPDDNTGYCEVNRPTFQGVTSRAKCVNYGGFGAMIVKNPITR